MFSTLGRSNKPLELSVILSPRDHDRLCFITTWFSQIGTRIRPRELSVHTERTRAGLPLRRTSTCEFPQRPISTVAACRAEENRTFADFANGRSSDDAARYRRPR
jgi:hypothetical protein